MIAMIIWLIQSHVPHRSLGRLQGFDKVNKKNIIRHLSIILIWVLFGLSACQSTNPVELPTTTISPSTTAAFTKAPTVTPTSTVVMVQPTVTIWHSWDESQIPVLVNIQRDFRALYPDVHFDVLYIPEEDLLSRFQVEAQRGGGPTVLLGPPEWGPVLYDASLIADLDNPSMDDLASTLNQPAMDASNYQDTRIAFPYSMSGVVLFRNKSIIPTRAETFADLVADAQFATQGDQIGAIMERSFFFTGAHLHGIGGRLMDEEAYPAFNDEYGLEWLGLLREFELAGPPDYLTDQDVEAFKEARVGWIIDATWNIPEFAESIGPENLSIDPWPAYQDGFLSGYVLSENLYLSTHAKGEHLDASLQFIEYFLSPEAQIQLTDIGLIPTSNDVQVVNLSTGHLLNQAITALSGGTAYPVVPEMEVYNPQMDIALKTYYEGAEAEDVLNAAAETIRERLDQFKPTEIPTPTPLP